MRPIVPRPSPPRSAWLIGLLLSLACLVAPSPASAQYVTSTGIACGEEEVSFDTLSMPTEGANAARLHELDKLYSYALAAWGACTDVDKAPPSPACDGQSGVACAADRLPGCGFVEAWLKTRKDRGWPPDGYMARGLLRTLDAELPSQALRALAHHGCSKSKGHLPEACVILATAEAAAKGTNLCEASDAKMTAALAQVAPERDAKDLAKMRDTKIKCDRAARACEPGDQRTASTYVRTSGTGSTLDYYGALGGDCPSHANYARRVSDSVARQVEEMKVDPFIGPMPDVAPPGSRRAQVFAALHAEAEKLHDQSKFKDGESCRDSTFYVGPTGALTQVDLPLGTFPTLCVDSSAYAIDRPLQVEIAAYRAYPNEDKKNKDGMSTRIPSVARAVWPGERATLNLDPVLKDGSMSMMRLTVRGYPRGVSLRALAQRGSSGSTLATSYEVSHLRMEARKVAEGSASLEAVQAKAKALDELAGELPKDPGYRAALTAMNDAVEGAAADAKKVEEARLKVEDAIRAISSFLAGYGDRPGSTSKAVRAAIVEAKKALPANTTAATNTLALLRPAQASVTGYRIVLDAVADKARTEMRAAIDAKDALDHKLTRLCRISKELIPVVDEDILVAPAGKGTYVLDYDWEAGFQRAPSRDLDEVDRVFVRVRRVRPGGSIAIAINDKGIVQHTVSLVGMPAGPGAAGAAKDQSATQPTDPVLTGGPRPSFQDLDPEQVVVQASSTQILALPGFDGAKRYELVLCALTDKNQVCPPPTAGDATSKARVIARNALVVHSKRYLGVRAGFGFSGAIGEVRTLVAAPNSATLKHVRGTSPTFDIAVPLLLTWYPWGRDAVDLPRGLSFGVGAGLDMVKTFQAKPKVYGALVADLWGFGLTAAYMVEGIESIDAAEGRYLTSASKTMRLYNGFFVGITTDLDIFEAVFRKYITGGNLPTVGTAGGVP